MISVLEILRGDFPTDRRLLTTIIFTYMRETRQSPVPFWSADKIARDIMKLIRAKKLTQGSLYGSVKF